jgi:hypothetical protein
MDAKDEIITRLKYELQIEREARIKLLDRVDDLQKAINNRTWRYDRTPTQSDLPHGHSRYSTGCRCDICRSEAAKYQRSYRDLIKQRNAANRP